MDRNAFLDLLEENHKTIVDLNRRKGHDYAGDDDALRNFKSQAADAGVTTEQVWSIFFGKHLAAIHTYVREGDVASEPIEGRILDAILYLYLLLGLVKEKRGLDGVE